MEKEASPPDGGWGWMVVLGAALINMVNQSMFANFGLIFGEKLKEMADGKATGITLVMAMSVMVTNFTGLSVGPLMRKFSIRTITIFGILCVGSGMIISSFSNHIWQIIIGYSVLTGLGLGLIASLTFLAINDYFTVRKSTAVGLSMTGTSVGQMLMPTFIGLLLKKYEFSGTTLILGLVSYSGILGALLFKPIFCWKRSNTATTKISLEEGVGRDAVTTELDPNVSACDENKPEEMNRLDKERPEEEKGLLKEAKKAKKSCRVPNGNKHDYKNTAIEITSSIDLANKDHGREMGCFQKVVKSLDLTLLKDFTFVHLSVGLSLGYLSSVSFSTFFPMFLQDEVNFSLIQTTSCMTALSFADILGRMTVSEICRRLKFRNKTSFMVGCVLLAICRSCMVELSEFKVVFAASLFVGYFRAATVINQNLVVSEYIEKDKLPAAVGLNMVSKGVFVMTLGQALGLLKDLLSYRICIHVLNVILFVVVSSWSIEALIRRKRK